MKVAFFDTREYEREFYSNSPLEIHWLSPRLNEETVELAKGYQAVCCFVEDQINQSVLQRLKEFNVQVIALRCAGYNNVDLEAARHLSMPVVRVPAYSPQSIAEFALGLLICLSRQIHKAHHRVREGNFSLNGLMGFELAGKSIGVLGTGKIGASFCRLLSGFGCEVLAYDHTPNSDLVSTGVKYVPLDELLQESHVISLHLPLTPETHYLLDKKAFEKMRQSVVIINTSRGGLIETKALIDNLKNKKIKAAGLDVYEEEEDLFFHDHSSDIIQDDQYARLMTFPNVLLTSHQAFLTQEALQEIAVTTSDNIHSYLSENKLKNSVVDI